jgi:hypothetical protein
MMRVAVRRRGDDDGDSIETIFYFYYEGYILHVVSKQLPQRKVFWIWERSKDTLDTLARICTLYINIPKPKVSKYIIHCPFNLVSDKGMDVQLRQCQHH